MSHLATFAVLATVAGSPFSMLYQAVGYTLVPRLRNAPDANQRRRVLAVESGVIAGTCLVAGVAVLLNKVVHRVQGIVQNLAQATSGTKDGGKPIATSPCLFQVLQHRVFHFRIPFLTPEHTEDTEIFQ